MSEASHMRGATAGFIDALRELPPDMQVLAACEALASIIGSGYKWRDVHDVAARVVDNLPRLIAEAAERSNTARAREIADEPCP